MKISNQCNIIAEKLILIPMTPYGVTGNERVKIDRQ